MFLFGLSPARNYAALTLFEIGGNSSEFEIIDFNE